MRDMLGGYLLMDTSGLAFYSRRLYRAAAKLNLYITGGKTAINNTKKAEGLLRDVKRIIWSIERELSELQRRANTIVIYILTNPHGPVAKYRLAHGGCFDL